MKYQVSFRAKTWYLHTWKITRYFIGTICFSYNTYTTNDKTLEKSAHLRQDAKDWRMEIAKYRANLDIVKMKLGEAGNVLSIPEMRPAEDLED